MLQEKKTALVRINMFFFCGQIYQRGFGSKCTWQSDKHVQSTLMCSGICKLLFHFASIQKAGRRLTKLFSFLNANIHIFQTKTK
ncbi:unnamed protein product [Staurois parvus]|uniref:Uncharacterized protein n=1 Tax=Staurois parvus TaxID=386267 RepID=A0ABN9FJT2_9NEOB|nr:unnamed protein product [Staurois parvus]